MIWKVAARYYGDMTTGKESPMPDFRRSESSGFLKSNPNDLPEFLCIEKESCFT